MFIKVYAFNQNHGQETTLGFKIKNFDELQRRCKVFINSNAQKNIYII